MGKFKPVSARRDIFVELKSVLVTDAKSERKFVAFPVFPAFKESELRRRLADFMHRSFMDKAASFVALDFNAIDL